MYTEVGCCEEASRKAGLRQGKAEICCVTRHRSREGGGARGVVELESLVSCRSSDQRWRTKLNFGSGKPLDDLHRSTALGTAIQGRRVFRGRSELFVRWIFCRAQQLEAKGQSRGTPAVGQETKMPDAHEALRKDVQ